MRVLNEFSIISFHFSVRQVQFKTDSPFKTYLHVPSLVEQQPRLDLRRPQLHQQKYHAATEQWIHSGAISLSRH
jgi:hypothetical protein